jgi:hypothetical protein
VAHPPTTSKADQGEVAPTLPDTDTEGVAGVGDPVEVGGVESGTVAGPPGGARIGEGGVTSRYAGAMLLHPFLDRIGAAGVLGWVCARRPSRYDDLGLLTATCLAFALGTSSVEATKHLTRK